MEESVSEAERNANDFVDDLGTVPIPPPPPPPRFIDALCQTEKQDFPEEYSHVFRILPALNDSAKLYTFTGVANQKIIDVITQCALSIAPDYGKILLPMKERVCLCLTKLKLNLPFTALSILYNISSRTCSNYFRDTLHLLAEVLKGLIYLPSKEETLANMPKCFKKFWRTRVVIDCAETPVEKLKNLKERIMTYSHYKGRETLKFGVFVTPAGLIAHISKVFGGRTSDKKIVASSGMLDRLAFGDAVMVDKGFMIEDECLQRGIILYRPPFRTKGKRFTKAEAMNTAEIASARVHVERVIQRLRNFDILKDQVPANLLSDFDCILTVCGALVNLSSPVLALQRF